MSYEATTLRVLAIPEIIELIMSFLDKKDNVNNACVCRSWSEIALDCIWRNVDDITQLLRLLAPLDTVLAVPPFQYYVSIALSHQALKCCFQIIVFILVCLGGPHPVAHVNLR